MSERASTFFPSACSGDRYATVPGIVPYSVRGSTVSVVADPSGARRSLSLASPKSSTFTNPVSVIITWAGFKSRWTIPDAWAGATASAIWMEYFNASVR